MCIDIYNVYTLMAADQISGMHVMELKFVCFYLL